MYMKYSVDRIIEGIAVLEDLQSNGIIEVELKNLPNDIHEGSILVFKDGYYQIEIEEEKNRRDSLRERLDRLKKLKK